MSDNGWFTGLVRRIRDAFSGRRQSPLPPPNLPHSINGVIAAHEAGHVMAAWASPFVVRVSLVNMVPHRYGITLYQVRRSPIGGALHLWDELTIALAGIAGESLVYGSFRSRNCRRDLENALEYARSIIASGGTIAEAPPAPIDGPGYPFSRMFRPEITETEAAFLSHGYARARRLIARRHADFMRLAALLLAKRRLESRALERLLGRRPWVFKI